MVSWYTLRLNAHNNGQIPYAKTHSKQHSPVSTIYYQFVTQFLYSFFIFFFCTQFALVFIVLYETDVNGIGFNTSFFSSYLNSAYLSKIKYISKAVI